LSVADHSRKHNYMAVGSSDTNKPRLKQSRS